MTIEEQLAVLRRGTAEIISEADLAKKLERGKPLRVKLGVDPTAKHVTLGWAVQLRKLRDFQRLGHTACLIIGDFTSMIGDPSGKNKTRPQLSREEVQANVDAVMDQFGLILDRDKTEIYFNADWLGKMDFADVIKLCSRYTVARILEREEFSKRLAEHKPISMHEILYPLCQGMDSVQITADVELGGTDQRFNNLVGRTLMEQYGQEPQVVMLCPLLVGTDGTEKMSQSLGNYISLVDSPNDMYGKTMSIPDGIIENYFELATDVPMDEVRRLIADTPNPRDVKRRLAREIVSLYHDADAARSADEYFVETISKGRQPADAEEAKIPDSVIENGLVNIGSLIASVGLAKSNSEARRSIKAGAVVLAGDTLHDEWLKLPAHDLNGKILSVGQHRHRKLIS